MDFLPTNELPLRPKKVEVYLTLRAFLTTTIRYFCALAPQLTVGYLYKYVCECLPSPFPGRPQLISSIVQGSSKQASSTNPIYQSKVGGIQEYTRVEVQLNLRSTVLRWNPPLISSPQNPSPTVFCPRLAQPDPS